LLVGYNKDEYLVKNSWGTSWGDYGYIRVKRTPGDTTVGAIGILSAAIYPTL